MATSVHCFSSCLALPSKLRNLSINTPYSSSFSSTQSNYTNSSSLSFSTNLSQNVFSKGCLSLSTIQRPIRHSVVCSSVILSSPTPKPCCASLKNTTITTPFLGFSVASSRPSVRTISKQTFRVRCQDKVVVPLDQRWMFEESEVNGPDIWNKTWYPKAADHVQTDKPWYVVDASDKILGRLASTIAIYIRGKNLATYTPSVDMGAFVIVVNAEKVAVSGKKRTQKLYRRHSGRPGGMKVETFDQLQQRIPERIIEHAVRGMLPKGRLGRALFNHLKVYKGLEHPHEAQQPVELPIRDKRIQKER